MAVKTPNRTGTKAPSGPGWSTLVGDDAAVMHPGPPSGCSRRCVLENVHFLLRLIRGDVGYKRWPRQPVISRDARGSLFC